MDGARGGQNSTWGADLLCGQDKPGLVRRLWVGPCAPRLRAGRGTRRSPPGLGQLRAQLRAGWTRLQGSRKQAYPCRRQRARAAHGGGFLCSPLGPQAPATPHPTRPPGAALAMPGLPPGPLRQKTPRKKGNFRKQTMPLGFNPVLSLPRAAWRLGSRAVGTELSHICLGHSREEAACRGEHACRGAASTVATMVSGVCTEPGPRE